MRFLATAVVLGAPLLAQTGSLTGAIVDADNKAVSKTEVQATNAASKAVFKATSSDKGEYTIGSLPPGIYDVRVESPIFLFKTFETNGVIVTAAGPKRLDIRLEDGITLNTLGEDREALAIFFKAPPALSGPTPKLKNGRPDFSGMWMPGGLSDDPSAAPQKIQAQPWAEALAKQRRDRNYVDVPSARCLPNGITLALGGSKFVHTPSLLVMLFEGDLPRQIYVDSRAHPKDLNPTWLGHSIGRWEGDTLVVDTVGFNDKTWLDIDGHPHTGQMHVIERLRRKDLGHMEHEMTVDDPGALVKPWTTKQRWVLNPKEDVQEFFCNENERDAPHLK